MNEIMNSMFSNILSSIEVAPNEKVIEYERKQKELEKENRIELLKQQFKTSGVGSKYFDIEFEDIEADTEELKNNLQIVHNFMIDVFENTPRTLWFCGKNGNGKTLLASLIIKECGGHFSRCYDIEDELKDAERFTSQESRKDVFERYKKYDVLVIDEIGRFQSEAELKFLFHILNDRYENNKSTVLCSNLSKDELKKYLGMALVDRFSENCTTVNFSGSSYRIKERKKHGRANTENY